MGNCRTPREIIRFALDGGFGMARYVCAMKADRHPLALPAKGNPRVRDRGRDRAICCQETDIGLKLSVIGLKQLSVRISRGCSGEKYDSWEKSHPDSLP